MTSVGIREFKTHLSRYVRLVKKGQSLALTEHGKTVATITPTVQSKSEEKMLELVRKGVIDWGGGKPRLFRAGIPCRTKLASEMVIEDRQERL
jgi:prevent-host-death family protein